MENTNAQIQKMSNHIDQVAPQIEFDPISVEHKPDQLAEQDAGAQVLPEDANIKEING